MFKSVSLALLAALVQT
jgi:hypothetical protein